MMVTAHSKTSSAKSPAEKPSTGFLESSVSTAGPATAEHKIWGAPTQTDSASALHGPPLTPELLPEEQHGLALGHVRAPEFELLGSSCRSSQSSSSSL